VLHHVLSNLTASELAPLRSVSIRLRDLATSNAHWRRCLLSDLVPNFVAFNEIAAIPPLLWSFSLVHDGWFRAYCELKRVVKAPWLRRDEDLIGAPWMVYFKSHLPSTELLGIEDPHATIRFTPDNMAEQVSGLPLNSRKWWIEDGVMRVSAYPPNVPGREPRTLCRKFEHSTVAMISDSPEYLEAMVRINNTIIKEAASERLVSQAEAESLRNAFEQAKKSIFPSSDFNMRNKRLRNVLGLTDERGDDREEDTVGTYTASFLFE
ncbi:hypothetical protein BDD12DRAFT_722532, partial [Trichophaea hybrida]